MIGRITFYLKTPIIFTNPIHLDGLLASVHPAMHNVGAISRFSQIDKIIVAPLPLDSIKINNCWVWCCSTGEFADDTTFFTDKFNKRRDQIDYLYLSGKHATGSGPARDRLESVYGAVCKSISFDFSASKINSRIEQLAKRVKNIGNMRKSGYGEVDRYEINEISNMTWQDCIIKNGEARRNLPQEMIVEKCDDIFNVVPPYWFPGGRKNGVTVGFECTLKDGVWLNEYK